MARAVTEAESNFAGAHALIMANRIAMTAMKRSPDPKIALESGAIADHPQEAKVQAKLKIARASLDRVLDSTVKRLAI
jgi:hypothetical protein